MFAKQLGYSARIIGLVYFVLPIIGLIAKPLFGAIGDGFRRSKFLFMLFQLITVASLVAIMYIPAIPAQSDFHCHEGESTMQFCPPGVKQMSNCTLEKLLHDPDNSSFSCQMKCAKNEVRRCQFNFFHLSFHFPRCRNGRLSATFGESLAFAHRPMRK